MNQPQRSELAQRIRSYFSEDSGMRKYDALAVVDIVEQFYKEQKLVSK